MEIGIKRNCFAYGSDAENGCNALNKLYCRSEKCKFYKPISQLEKEKEQINE